MKTINYSLELSEYQIQLLRVYADREGISVPRWISQLFFQIPLRGAMHLCYNTCTLSEVGRVALREGDTTTGYTNMAGQHSLSNHQITIKFPHPIWRQIELEAADHHMTEGEYIRWKTTQAVESRELTPEDAMIIASRIAEAHEKGKMV